MATKFTEEQQKAIETTDKSVLVSAAAGSGKTAVLIKRIINIILDGKANVDEMLVVTFTNAAAAEMKIRLASAIRKRMADHPEDAPHMKDQLARLYKAYISTIDSFARRVIKEFFHMTDMEPSFGIADDAQCELMRREALAELFEEAFDDDSLIEGGSFRAFLRLYSEERSDEQLMNGILRAYSGLRSMPDYFEWAYKKAEQLMISPDTFDGTDLQRLMYADIEEVFAAVTGAFNDLNRLFSDAGLEKLFSDKLAAQMYAAQDILVAVRSGEPYAVVTGLIDSFPSVRLTPSKDQKEAYSAVRDEADALRKAFKKDIDDLRKRYMIPDIDSRLREMNATYGYTVYYLRLLEEFERRYDAKKREKKVIDFADMEHIAVRILKNDEAADVLRRRFRFIFVDEYQDTNNIQEYLISRIARPDNVFRVGDVKQSIYKFRQAEPEIFERLYAKFSSGADPDGIAIDLGRNFRTNAATIRYINHVFSNVMEGYDERAMLCNGLDCPAAYDFVPEVHVLTGDGMPDEDGSYDDTAEDEDMEELSKEEAEAAYIARLAASIIGTEFYDTKAGKVRSASARDIAILYRAVKRRGDVMSRALGELAIDSHVDEGEDYFDTTEISIAMSLLMCIDNMKRDLPLISVLHSEVFGFSPEDLALIRIAHTESGEERGAYWKAFEWFAVNGPDGALRDRVIEAKNSILEWRMLSRVLPLEDFAWKVLVDSGYYSMAGAMPGGSVRQANLRSLADRAGQFSRDSVATLSSFISFLDVLRSRKLSNGQASVAGKDDDVVHISTIHKSKGLEYPFVIVGGLGHRFRYDSNDKGFSFDSEAGVGLPYVDPSRRYWRSTLLQRAINSKAKRDSYKEELRLLYVAMTRARNKLYLVGTCGSEAELMKYQTRPANFLRAVKDVLRSPWSRLFTSPLELRKTAEDKSSGNRIKELTKSPLSPDEQALYDEIDRRFGYRYPDEELLTAKAKYSVSELRRLENESRQAESPGYDLKAKLSGTATVPDGSDSEPDLNGAAGGGDLAAGIHDMQKRRRKVSAADAGTAYHRILEFLDFTKAADAGGRADPDYIRERAEFLRDRGAIDADVFDSLDLGRIEAFFGGSLGRRALRAAADGRLQKEKPFTLKTEYGGRDILVQGIIDCCFEEDGRMIVLDYKSSFIDPRKDRESEYERIRREYRVQTDLYAEAIRKGTGKCVSEIYLYLFATGEAIRMSS